MKGKRKSRTMQVALFGPPTPEIQRRAAAENMARTIIETDPGIEAKRKELAQAVLQTTRRVMSGSRPYVKRRR